MRFTGPLRFRFRLVPFLAMLVVVAIGCALGQWQLRRADQKRAIDVKLAQRGAAPVLAAGEILKPDATSPPASASIPSSTVETLEYRRIRARGSFVQDWPLYLDNRPYQSRAGLYVLMPFRLAGSDRVLMIARGWIARDPRDRQHVPPLRTPGGEVDIEGRVRRAPGRVMQLGEAAPPRPGAILQNVDLTEVGRAAGLPLQPLLIEQTAGPDDGLVRDWPQPSSGIERHLGYAFQWFALAATAFVFFVVTGFKRGKSASA